MPVQASFTATTKKKYATEKIYQIKKWAARENCPTADADSTVTKLKVKLKC